MHPHKRTWTLGGLDRASSYRLWFDPVAFRWEVAAEAGDVPGAQPEARSDRACAEPSPGGGAGGAQVARRSRRWTWVRPV